jgi:hypothetical protein
MLPVRADKHATHRDPPPATVSLVPVTDVAASRVQPWWRATAASDATVSMPSFAWGDDGQHGQ